MKYYRHKTDIETNILLAIITLVILVLTVSIFAATNVIAMTGSGGGITMHSSLGDIAFITNTSGIYSVSASTPIIGSYENVFDNAGHFDYLNINTPLAVTLIAPLSKSGTTDIDVNLTFNLSTAADNCSITLDNAILGTLYGLNKGLTTIAANSLTIDKHYWNISCYLSNNNVVSTDGEFSVTKAVTFNNESTDFTAIDISNITNLTLAKPDGKILFTENINLSSGIDLDQYVHILPGSIIIDSGSIPQLNKSATLTIKNIPWQYVVTLKNGLLCPTCSLISNAAGEVVFDVSGFSNYTVSSTARLDVYSTAINDTSNFTREIIFAANYTNRTSYAYITASCQISFYNGSWSSPTGMSFNTSSNIYEYSGNFNQTGIYDYNINCTPSESGFDTLSLNDMYTISGTAPGSFSDITLTVGNSSRMNITNSNLGSGSESASSNVTGLDFEINAITSTWQGYYGNLTGSVVLQSANGTKFYDWSFSSPTGEIYATRSAIISWSSIRCANHGELVAEDTYLGINDSYSDSIERTFFNTTTFNNFYTGFNLITPSQDCYATNIYGPSGPQNSDFSEIILSDGHSILYTTLFDGAAIGFDNRPYDFELMVGANGNTRDGIETYYFFIEIG